MSQRPLSSFEFVGFVNVLTNAAGAVTLNSHANCTVPVNSTGAGDISVTFLDTDATETICLLEGHTAAGGLAAPTIVHTSDTAKQLLLWDTAGAATDGVVSCALFKINPSATGADGSGMQGRSQQARDIVSNTMQFVGGVILTTNGAGAPTVIRNDGCTIPALGTGAGDITIVLPEAVSLNQAFMAVWAQSATALYPSVTHTSATQKQLLLCDQAGAGLDGTIGAYFFRVPGMGT